MLTIRFSGRVPSPRTIEIGQETDSNADKLRFLLPQVGSGQAATLQMIFPDGTADAINITDGMITLPASALDQAGRIRAWVEILAADAVAWHSELFYLDVGELPVISEIVEQQYPTAFQETMAQTTENRRKAEAWAVGQRDGTDVESTDETYQNNAKYYSQQGAASAAAAAASAAAVAESEAAAAASAENAAASEAAAAASESNAADSEAAAAASETNAAVSETAAAGSATAAAGSAADAAGSATAAAGSAEDAAGSAEAAAESAEDAAASAASVDLKMLETDAENVDMDIADYAGNVLARLSGGHIAVKHFDSAGLAAKFAEKQDALTFDSAPTSGSNNPVKSGGIYMALSGKQDTLTIDGSPTDGSNNPVKSGGVYAAMEEIKEDIEAGEAAVADVKAEIGELPKVKAVQESYADLYVADDRGNVIAQFAGGHIQTKNFDSSETKPTGTFEWKFSGSDLLLSYGYGATADAVVVLNEGRANGLFDFAKLCTKPRGTPLASLETADLTVVWSSGTDMHGPFQFLAVNNADGYHADATDPSWVGGNHTLDQMGAGWETASSKGVQYFADGRPVSSGNGKANIFEIKWANGVQAYNTAKQGGGRECLIEYHDMIFDGVRFEEQIRLVPSEDIKMELWYGLQFVSFGTKYTSIVFEDATNRQTFASTDSNIISGNAAASGMLAWGANDAIEVRVDAGFDLGKRDYYSGNQGAFATSSGKGYFTIINKAQMADMAAGTSWFLRGSYRFFPA